MTLDDLPLELILAIIDHAPPQHLQRMALSLHRAIPAKGIPVSHFIFKHIRLGSTAAIVKFMSHIRHSPEDAARVRELYIDSWDADAEVVKNLLAMIPDTFTITSLVLCIDPKNIAPHQLDTLLSRPILGLQSLVLRFHLYLGRSNYHSFHAGTYFDSSLSTLAKWPSGSLPALAIIQDPNVRQHSFAQPLVFFDLEPITTLGTSAATRNLSSLKLRLPSKDLTRYLCAGTSPFPSMHLLDLSTCDVRLNHLESIFIQFPELRHIIVDGCNLFRGVAPIPDLWRVLGEKCALYGIKKAKDREALLLQSSSPSNSSATAELHATDTPSTSAIKGKGRKGVASASITLRTPRPSQAGRAIRESRIVPPPPTLASFSTTLYPEVDPIIAQQLFERGWLAGLKQLNAIRRRLRGFWLKGQRVFEFLDESDSTNEANVKGLVQIEPGDEDAFIPLSDVDMEGVEFCPVPVLCLASEDPPRAHTSGCGHRRNWHVWKDAPEESADN